MNIQAVLVRVVVAVLGSWVLVECGGSGGGIVPAANPPTCSSLVIEKTRQTVAPGLASDHRIWVPPSTVELDSDLGVRAHTNHLVLRRTPNSRGNTPVGLTPAQITTAYRIPTGGSGAIAVVDAFDDPNALHDFNVFSSTFGLPTESSGVATSSSNQVFQVVWASGSQPAPDGGWAQEISIDTQWAHAVAPGAKIYLVEAASASSDDLFAAVALAKTLPGVRQISMSFGRTEAACSFVHYDGDLVQSGVTFFAAAGDTVAQRDYPAESSNVVCVGGTTLQVASNGQWLGESVWNAHDKQGDGTGSGPSRYEPRPRFQDRVASLVGAYRGACDIAADADPLTGVPVYDSFAYGGYVDWITVGGTSVSCPIVAAIANVSGVAHTSSQDQNSTLYAGIGGPNFHDITTGDAQFKALPGWDFPTGVGTPNGIRGF